MSDFVTVKSNEPNAVGLWEKHPAHPAGEALVTGGMVVKVANTPLVQRLVSNGKLALTDEPTTAPWPGYDEAGVDTITKRMGTLGDMELIAVRQYEAAHKNRKKVLTADVTPEAAPEVAPVDSAPAAQG